MSAGKLIILVGVVIVVIGLAIQFGLPLGRLPGDVKVSRGNTTFYAPLATGLVISVVLTILLNILLKR